MPEAPEKQTPASPVAEGPRGQQPPARSAGERSPVVTTLALFSAVIAQAQPPVADSLFAQAGTVQLA